jgi:hypothetical protein
MKEVMCACGKKLTVEQIKKIDKEFAKYLEELEEKAWMYDDLCK